MVTIELSQIKRKYLEKKTVLSFFLSYDENFNYTYKQVLPKQYHNQNRVCCQIYTTRNLSWRCGAEGLQYDKHLKTIKTIKLLKLSRSTGLNIKWANQNICISVRIKIRANVFNKYYTCKNVLKHILASGT